MYHYLFTNDLRISHLEDSLIEAGKCFETDTVPSANVDKNANNNMNTLGFYFNLTKESVCARECSQRNVRKVVLNFIKKFQFPNPRTQESYNQTTDDGILLAPMRVILQILYVMNIQMPEGAFLTKKEIADFIFFNSEVAKSEKIDLLQLIKQIEEFRSTGNIPQTIELNEQNRAWKQEERQVREMVKVLTWSGCVTEEANGNIRLESNNLTMENKADLFDILSYNSFWSPSGDDFKEIKRSYQEYMDLHTESIGQEEQHTDENEYERAARIINDHILETGFEFEKTEDELKGLTAEFNAKFSPDKLMSYSDDELMEAMFYTAAQTNDSMTWWLEFHKEMRGQFGSIAGGTSLKYGIYQNKEQEWITGGSANKRVIPYEEALEIGKDVRDKLVKGAEIIRGATLETVEDYEKLHDDLIETLGSFATNNWVHKYFFMIFPDKFTVWHSEDWQKHALRCVQIRPSEKAYGRSGQIAIVCRYAQRNAAHLSQALYDKFGGIKQFCRLGTSDGDGKYADDWKREKVVALGWKAIGSLDVFSQQGNASSIKKSIAESLQSNYYPNDAGTASRKAGELQTFYNTGADTVFVTMDGESLIALADNVGDYYFDANESMCHRKPAIWHSCFSEDERLPKKAEGHMTSCFELKDEDNLMYLYKKYYYDLSEKEGDEQMAEAMEYAEPIYTTGILDTVERNRIVFGAPGTGKSWLLKKDSTTLLEGTEGTMERVTFHPDYSYAQFVGTYKPVSDSKGDIRYEFVAGPFMRVFVDAILSGRSGNPQPHLLLIEEINRAKVAAVFGDVFQLLDRDEEGKSEYEIQTSKDVRKYLADNLGGLPEQWDKIKLPDNMFIWATMNSADQGVFPMDTAFKRRWSFEYLGINENEEGVVGTVDIAGETIDWNKLRRAINDKLAKDYKVNEDKLMGPYFLAKKLLVTDDAGKIVDQDRFIKAFKSKVIMYLYEDAAKQHKHKLFEGCDSSKYSSVCDDFDRIGIRIFGDNFKAEFYEQQEG